MLVNKSALLYPSDDPLASWLESDLVLEADLTPYSTCPFQGGADRYPDIVPDDFFDDDWVLGDECPGKGVHSLVDIADVSLVVAPDLYSPRPLAPVETIVDPGTFAGAEFAECIEPPPTPTQAMPPDDITGLRLDPVQDLDVIAGLQRRLTDLADELESFVVLLDVPPGLSQRAILYWRGKFTSPYCAGYHPWVDMAPPDDQRNRPVAVNPSAIAAGIIAQREILFGVAYGPANVIANGAISVEDRISPARHDELHQHAVNVYLSERDGIRLTAARTLALDQTWRQLNVRRLVTMIRRVLDRQMQWAVFEPNNRQLRTNISHMLRVFPAPVIWRQRFYGGHRGRGVLRQMRRRIKSSGAVRARAIAGASGHRTRRAA